MAPRVGTERLAQAAFWYYVQDLGQDEVARRLNTSRSNDQAPPPRTISGNNKAAQLRCVGQASG